MVLMQVEVITLLMQKQPEDLPEIWKEQYLARRVTKTQEFLLRISVP